VHKQWIWPQRWKASRDITVTPATEEVAARLALAAAKSDAARCDAILAEIGDTGLDTALAVLAVQTRSLVAMLTLEHGREETRKLFERTILDAGAVLDE
jgi:hypothetical protein